MPVTLTDVAKKADVSIATVSRVVNKADDPFISQKTRARVIAVAREMGYRPNRAARALATGRTNVIALWMPDLASAHVGQIIHHVRKQIRQHGFEMITSEFGEQTGWLSGDMGSSGWPVDGILAYNGGEWLRAAVEKNSLGDIPFVSMGSSPTGIGDIVEIGLGAAVREAVYHLIDGGCRRVAHLLSTGTNYDGEERRETYAAVMKEAGMRPEFILCNEGIRASARETLREYVEMHGCPDGIFCANDDLAIGAYRGLHDLGMRIPDDVALIGCDGIEDTEYMDTPISTIIQPLEEMCRIAWQFLQQRITDPTSEARKATLEAYLIVRESSRMSNSGKGGC